MEKPKKAEKEAVLLALEAPVHKYEKQEEVKEKEKYEKEKQKEKQKGKQKEMEKYEKEPRLDLLSSDQCFHPSG